MKVQQGLDRIDKHLVQIARQRNKQEELRNQSSERKNSEHSVKQLSGFSSYLADRHRSFYDRDFGADRYAFEAYGGGCCYCDGGNDDDDGSYGYSGDDCSDCCGDSGGNSWRGAGD